MKTKHRFVFRFNLNIQSIKDLSTVKSRHILGRAFKMIARSLGQSLNRGLTRNLSMILLSIYNIRTHQGIKGTVLYLKTCSVVLQQHLGDHHETDLTVFGPRISRNRGQLPRILPPVWRNYIRDGNKFYIRFALSIFALYRVLEFPGKLKISTITAPFKGDKNMIDMIVNHIPYFCNIFKVWKVIDKSQPNAILWANFKSFPIFKASAPSRSFEKGEWSTHFLAIMRSICFLSHPSNESIAHSLFNIMKRVIGPRIEDTLTPDELDGIAVRPFSAYKTPLFNGGVEYLRMMRYIREAISGMKSISRIRATRPHYPVINFVTRLPISLIDISDFMIQTLMNIKVYFNKFIGNVRRDSLMIPLNSYSWRGISKLHFLWFSIFDRDFKEVMNFVRGIFKPLNGPLGRLGLKDEPAGKVRVFAMVDPITQWALYPIHRVLFKILRMHRVDGTFNQLYPLYRAFDWPCLYSFDLSAATDRLPISLQGALLDHLWPGISSDWKEVLVGRRYYHKDEAPNGLIYAVGQPMGALSSWAMLAFTHHFIVQVAALRGGVVKRGRLFTQYALLGDDIVIGNRAVAREYLVLMKGLGVDIGLHKSINSPQGLALEFAKRTFFEGTDVSPISLKELEASLKDVNAMVSYMHKYTISIPTAIAIAGYGYKVLGGLNKPFRKLNQGVQSLILTFCIPKTKKEFISFMTLKSLISNSRIINPILYTDVLSVHLRSMVNLASNKFENFFSEFRTQVTLFLSHPENFILVKKDVNSKALKLSDRHLSPFLRKGYSPLFKHITTHAYTVMVYASWIDHKFVIINEMKQCMAKLIRLTTGSYPSFDFFEIWRTHLKFNGGQSSISFHDLRIPKYSPSLRGLSTRERQLWMDLNPKFIQVYKRSLSSVVDKENGKI
jgi:hypothetical protein